MSEVKVDKISPRSGTDVTLGDSGDTFTIPSGATITNSGTATGFGGDNTPSFHASLSADQTGTTNSAWNKIEFDREDWDTDSAYDNSTNYRFTVPAGEGGKYVFVVNVGVAPTSGSDAATDYASVRIYKNGSGYPTGSGMVRVPVNESGVDVYLGCTTPVELAATDYVEAYCWHDMGTSRKFAESTSFFAGWKLIGV